MQVVKKKKKNEIAIKYYALLKKMSITRVFFFNITQVIIHNLHWLLNTTYTTGNL